MPNKTKGAEHREKLRDNLFPGEEPWIGESEKGWFRAPRTLPLVIGLIDSKKLSDRAHPSHVYLELWAQNMGEGFIVMKEPEMHAYPRDTSAAVSLSPSFSSSADDKSAGDRWAGSPPYDHI